MVNAIFTVHCIDFIAMTSWQGMEVYEVKQIMLQFQVYLSLLCVTRSHVQCFFYPFICITNEYSHWLYYFLSSQPLNRDLTFKRNTRYGLELNILSRNIWSRTVNAGTPYSLK